MTRQRPRQRIIPHQPIDWPTRERWAKQQRTAYIDNVQDFINSKVTKEVTAYATAEEIAATLAALKASWNSLTKPLKQANRRARSVDKPYTERTKQEHALCEPANDIWWQRQSINAAIASLRGNWVPVTYSDGGNRPEVAVILDRYKTACDAASSAYEAKVAKTPIDDATWNKELERRRDIERRWGLPITQ